ncbi:MAG: iron ABC transporter permease [Proteobacteria bacterium]|nr:iron ABC transporter permease [Pseudomonadota bacterium]
MKADPSALLARRDWFPYAVGALTVVAALAFLVYPLAYAMFGAFIRNGEEAAIENLTLVNFERFFTSASYKRALWNSIFAGGLSTLLAAALALPMAYAVARIAMPFRALILALSVVPLISPPFIGAYAWIILLGNNGVISQLLRTYLGIDLPSIYGPFGVVFALALSYFPYVFLIVQGALAAADPYIEEAARVMGASRARILRTITLPSILPSIAAGMLIVFIKAVGDFGVPSILGGEFQVLPTLIYYQIHGFFNLNGAAAVAMVNVALTVLALAVLAWIDRTRSYATITGTARAARRATGLGARLFANLYCWLVLLVAILPQATVVFSSFAERWAGTLLPTIYGLDHYRRVMANLTQPIVNSLILAGAATAVCIVFGTVTAYATIRGKVFAKWALDLTIMLPFVLPGLVVGVAYLIAFNSGWLILTGTGLIIVLAYFTRRVAFIFRSVSAAVSQVDMKIEEASTICGATWGQTMRRITVPLIAPGILAGGVLVFSTLIGEVSATVLLYSARWKTISIAIYELVLGDELYKASAVGTIAIVLTLLLVLAASRLAGKNMADMFR